MHPLTGAPLGDKSSPGSMLGLYPQGALLKNISSHQMEAKND